MSKGKKISYVQQETPLVYLDVPHWGIVGTGMVPASRDSKTFAGDVSMSASGLAVGIGLCGLAYRSNRFNHGFPQG